LHVTWSGASDPGREARPPVRGRARILEQRPIERPRSVDAQHRESDVEEVFPRERHEGLSRAFNVAVAGVGFLLALPVMILVAILIKLTSRGPILYTQTRVGLDRRWKRTLPIRESRVDDLGGQVFTIYKLRTMRVDAERSSGAVWATENDPRVTRLGKFLRQYRIDEVPQLWNVLRGDMNMVGPRPERPSIVARLREDIPTYRFRHRVKPGLTGLAQIHQKYDACLDDVRSKVNWDLRYLKEQSFWKDVNIMVQTVPSVLLRFRGW
jgi:lipopolysaccharide/colanic/teichoic acid biosynthesis glycosyltransferase